ncbi:hypothetical protein GCM10010517_62260 [Streptosporangium fragile]|uniref:Uncharacterized protein n=1 Tax=Streptosporangium fragile TaxID=46186 RepID=A0ABP6INA9_9ACTN
MKSILMSSQRGLASAQRNTVLPCGGQAILTVGAPAPVWRDKSVHFQVAAGRCAALVALPATGAAVLTLVDGDYAPTEHIENGGLRGPQPWRNPPVIN